MSGYSVENVPGSATVYFETAAVLMKRQIYDCFYCFVWVLSLVFHIKGRIQLEGIREQGPEEAFGPNSDEVRGKWNRLHKEELLRSSQLTKCYQDDQINNNDMGRARGTYGRDDRFLQDSGGET